MRRIININNDWQFFKCDCPDLIEKVNVPHTWNGLDGQDGGGDYWRGECIYKRHFKVERKDNEEVFIRFNGVNQEAEVFVNGHLVGSHHSGYSAFCFNITEFLEEENELEVKVSNAYTRIIYPQKADFTFYGGIYRDVNLIVVNKTHFDLDYHAAKGIQLDPKIIDNDGILVVTPYCKNKEAKTEVKVFDKEGNLVASGLGNEEIKIPNVIRWHGLKNPYLYKVEANLVLDGEVVDQINEEIGFRTFSVDPKKGFILNGEVYPLRGVSKHQDRLHIGNAISHENMEEDIDIIIDLGATSVRLAHYQHDEYVYELCDRKGLVVWSEIPYISSHVDEANENAEFQMKELIYQTYNRTSIFFRCLSNEITMKKAVKKHRLGFHEQLNVLVKKLDPSRMTVTAGFAGIGAFNKLNKVCDLFAYNFYFGWYVPFYWLNNIRLGFYHTVFPKRCLGLSEYGAEAMTNLHSAKPKRFDNSEEYQAIYHEKLLKIIAKRDYLWSTYVWNMYDFGADARNQGGDPGKNHKGLVTFDRKIKKDAYYIYRAYWSKDPFVHLCGSRFVNRVGKSTEIKVYTNLDEVELFVNDKSVGKKSVKDHKVIFKVALDGDLKVEAKSGDFSDLINIKKVEKPDPTYVNKTGNSYSWEKKKANVGNKKQS